MFNKGRLKTSYLHQLIGWYCRNQPRLRRPSSHLRLQAIELESPELHWGELKEGGSLRGPGLWQPEKAGRAPEAAIPMFTVYNCLQPNKISDILDFTLEICTMKRKKTFDLFVKEKLHSLSGAWPEGQVISWTGPLGWCLTYCLSWRNPWTLNQMGLSLTGALVGIEGDGFRHWEGGWWLAQAAWNDIFALDESKEPGVEQRPFRHSAYWQFVLWQHGCLGVGRRVVIASCCVWNIRDTFPDPRAHYTGFRRCLDV